MTEPTRERSVAPDDEFVSVPMRLRDGSRWGWKGRRHDHTRVRIVAVPGGRRRKITYVKVDPQGMGNGRADRGEHRADPADFHRHYLPADEAGLPSDCESCGAKLRSTMHGEHVGSACRSCGWKAEFRFDHDADRWVRVDG